MYIRSLFEHTELILLVAIVFPLFVPIDVHFMQTWVSYVLGIVMFLSIRPFFKQKAEMRKDWKSVIISILLSYVLLSGVYLLLAFLFFPILSDYFIGYVLLAIVPPAVSIVPLCYLTKCDIDVADTGIFAGYLLALIIIPVASYVIFGKNFDFLQLVKSLSIIIVLPTILAYFSRNLKLNVFKYTKICTGLLLGIILFISVSLNRSSILNIADSDILHILIMNVGVIFTLGLAVYYFSRRLVPESDAINYSLYATQKNEATGIAIAVVLFSSNVAIPLIFAIIVQFLFFIVFERFVIKNIA